MLPLVYILILNWKSAPDTIKCVESIQSSSFTNYKILLIDNSSPDNSEKTLRDYFPDFPFIQTGSNLGYAGGNNLGIQYALKAGADFVWILNPDIRAASDALTHLVSFMVKNERVGIVGPRFCAIYGEKKTVIDGYEVYPEKGYVVSPNISKQQDQPNGKQPGFISGSSMLIRSSLFKNIGLMREDFFLYLEEVEFNLRAKKFGSEVDVCREAFVTHMNTRQERTFDGWYLLRNRIILARIQKKHVLKTMILNLNLKKAINLFAKGHIREATRCVFRRLRPLLRGLFMKLKPIPTVKI